MEGKMWLSVKRFYSKLLPGLIIFSILFLYLPAWAQQIESTPNKFEPAPSAETASNTKSDRPAGEMLKQPKKIDRAGEKIGQGIDKLTQKASPSIGSWINVTVFAGITWLKLILVLLLLFVVLVVERVVRLALDRQRKKEKDEKKIKHIVLEAVAKPLSLFIWVYGI